MALQVTAARFLQPGTSVNVWLDLTTPDSTDNGNGDMFQVGDFTSALQ